MAAFPWGARTRVVTHTHTHTHTRARVHCVVGLVEAREAPLIVLGHGPTVGLVRATRHHRRVVTLGSGVGLGQRVKAGRLRFMVRVKVRVRVRVRVRVTVKVKDRAKRT